MSTYKWVMKLNDWISGYGNEPVGYINKLMNIELIWLVNWWMNYMNNV